MTHGMFIALEGGEGAGKSTQARMLADALGRRGIDAIVTREPGGTPGAEAIRQLLLDTDGDGWNPRAEALLFAAARSDHVEKLIRPALEAGTWVIADRFVDSSRAYQGGGGGLPDETITALHDIGSEGLLPDLTVLIEVAPETAAQRTHARDGGLDDRIGGRDDEFHAKVARRFGEIADAEPDRFVRIDGNADPESTHKRIVDAVMQMRESRP